MSHNFSLKHYEDRTFIILIAIIFGFISSKALISIGTAILFINFLFSFKQHPSFLKKLTSLPILAACLFFLTAVVLFFNNSNYQIALSNLWAKLPWFIIPLSIAALKPLSKSYFTLLINFIIFIICISGLVVLINYFSNYTFYTEIISKGQHIPTPLNHIRFSLMAAFAGISALFLWLKSHSDNAKSLKIAYASASFFIFILLHILAVRSGLVTYYIGILYLIVYFTFTNKKIWLLPIALALFCIAPFVAYYNVASFKSKVDYMMYDLQQMNASDIGHNSDARRMRAFKIGLEMIQEKPILGYGLGNVDLAVKTYYQEHFSDVEIQNQKIPHNQFMYTFLELGIIGFAVLMFALLFPLLMSLWFKNPLFVVLSLIILASCMVENTLDGQLGLTFYLVFASLLLKLKPNE